MFMVVLSVLLVITLVLFVITRFATETIVRLHYEQKADFFAHYAIQPGDVVFLGDSITDGARWHELFPYLPAKNRGINADTLSGVLHRIGDTLAGHPAALFLLIGTNDLPWFMFHDDANILKTYEAVVSRCKAQSPDSQVFIQSILPRHRRFAKRIQTINAQLEALALRCGCTFVNLYPHFAGPNGELRADFTNDNLHLMASGYARWVEILTPYLVPFKSVS
jgi:lysophospholipase L1-like esterase